jgi:hypothetical protein
MNEAPTSQLRLVALMVTTIAALALAGPASAGSYTVVSCNSAQAFGFNASAWEPYSSAGSTYATCPTGGGFTAGVSNRMTGQPYGGFSFSGHAFTAPAGTTITAVRWGGRLARNNCTWGTFMRAAPSGAAVLGLRNGQHCDQTDFDITNYPITFPTPAGTTRLEQLVICGAATCSPGAAMHSHVLEVTIDDPQPPSISLSGRMVSGQWVSGRASQLPDLDAGASDSSGIHSLQASIETQQPSQAYSCNWSLAQPCPARAQMTSTPSVAQLADGRHTLRVSAVDAAGNFASAASDVYVDNTPPDPVVPEIVGGSDWRRTNGFRVLWAEQANSTAPITRVHWKVCLANGTCPARSARAVGDVREIPNLQVPAPGEYRLHLWLEDAAGNQREANSAVSVPIRFDPEAPELSFALQDPADPLRVAVNAMDRYSGIATGEIEMRAVGTNTWHGLATNRQGPQLVAHVDDERFRKGLYEFRAHAEDQAGNEASTTTRTDGATASLRLPARIDTRLVVGFPRRRHPTSRVLFQRNASVRFGRRVRLMGRLTNADGQPIEAASIEALERGSDGNVLPVGLATTDRGGRFRYVLRASHNRDVLFHYGGSRRIGSATAAFHLRVAGTTSIHASRRELRNGESVLFTGRVATRSIPSAGKLLEMQAFFRARWRTFSTLRTDALGRWRFRYRFGATLGRVTYRFRARLPGEGDYPFVDGTSRVVRVVVLGS